MTELPKPTVYAYNVETRCNNLSAFSADQLRDYGRAEYQRAIEQCADIVENADTPDCGGWTAQGIADAIRELAGEKT